jgi:hypothetical protein
MNRPPYQKDAGIADLFGKPRRSTAKSARRF